MDFKEQLEKKYEKEMEQLKQNKPNLMLVGGSGVGKSSLINKIFGGLEAKVGVGEPETKEIRRYASAESLINIFDTMGYETQYSGAPGEEVNKFENKVLVEINQRKNYDLSEQIHIIWYCIAITNHRVFDYDIDNIKGLQRSNIPLFVVFTKCDEDTEDSHGKGVTAEAFKKTLSENGLGGVKCFETASEGELSFELDALIEESCNALTHEGLRKAFAVAQIHNIPLKRTQAHSIIHSASAAAAAAAVTPLPCADAPVITGIQVAMAMGLAKVYGFSNLGDSAMALLKTQLVSILGKQLVASLTKFIPVLGSIVNASVAVSLTEALGWSLVAIYEKVLEEYLKTGKEPVWAQIFSSDILALFVSQKMESSKK